MSILKETTEVLERAEEKSGIPVEVTTDPSLPTLASIKVARAPATHHVLTYNPTKPGVDYHVAYQCGFALRLFENPAGERYEFGGGHDMGFDLSTEYETDQQLFLGRKG